MKVYLDDTRDTPAGWIRVYWPDEAIELLKTGEVTEISLDHDLGDDARGTGYDVVLWLEKRVFSAGFVPPFFKGDIVPPKMTVHSANTSARDRMNAGIASIMKRSPLTALGKQGDVFYAQHRNGDLWYKMHNGKGWGPVAK